MHVCHAYNHVREYAAATDSRSQQLSQRKHIAIRVALRVAIYV